MLHANRVALFHLLVVTVLGGVSLAQPYATGDINGDRNVDFKDLVLLAGSWLSPACQDPGCEADLNSMNGVDVADFALLAEDWGTRGASPVISEFMASNGSKPPLGEGDLLDGEGFSADWIELYNPTDETFDLKGWYLTDDAGDLDKWEFPVSVVLEPGQFRIVFASGKDKVLGGSELHTNFQLDIEGGYLALVRPDGITIAHEYASYPEQLTDVSYGLAQHASTLVSSGATAAYHVPADGTSSQNWMAVDFDDSEWDRAATGLGFAHAAEETGQDIGQVSVPGYHMANGGMYTVLGAGEDIWGNADSFYYVYTPLAGDGELTARIINMSNTNEWAKAGVMIRETLAPGSRYAAQVLTVSHGTAFQRRVTTNGSSSWDQGGLAAVPYWVKITRRGNVLTGFHSHDGVNWMQQGSESIQMAQQVYIGLCVTSHASGAMCLAVFDNVSGGGEVTSDLKDKMLNINGSLWSRIEFDVEQMDYLDSLVLRLKYEDAFVAYLNGVEIARDNITGAPLWNSVADANRPKDLASRFTAYDASGYVARLREGRNVLAIHGLNDDKADEEFLILPELTGSSDVAVPQYLANPSPRQLNLPGSVNIVADTKFSHDRGFYNASFAVAITTQTKGATIHYTTDGSAPSEAHGQTYTVPLAISNTTCLRAMAFKPGWVSTNVDTHTYIFPSRVIRQAGSPQGFPGSWGGTTADYEMDPDVVNDPRYNGLMKDSLLSIPTMSIVTDVGSLFGANGIYTNSTQSGVNWERPASVEYVYPDGTTGFQVDAGLRIYGGAFRGMNLTRKKSFRLLFKREYGPTKLNYRLFDDEGAVTSFDTVILRAGANDAWNNWGGGNTQYIVDEFMRQMQLALGRPSAHGTFVHLYLNGLYWGLYNVTERPVSSFCASYFGGDKSEWDALNSGDPKGDSNTTTWNAMLSQARAGLSDMVSYQRIQGNNPDGTDNPAYDDLLDVENYVDYMFSNFWGGTGDWPWHNWYVGCRRPPNATGFKFFNWDSEGAIIIWSNLNANVTGVSDGAAVPYNALRQNGEFCRLFGDHVQRHLFNDGPALSEACYARYKELADEVELAIIAESARWGDQARGTPYTQSDWMAQRNYILNTYMPQRPAIVLSQLRSAGLYPNVDAPAFLVNGSYRHGGQISQTDLVSMGAAGGTIYYTTDGSDPRVPVEMSGGGDIETLLVEDAPKRVLVPSVANGGDQLSNTPAKFEVTYYKANITVDHLNIAEAVINNPGFQSAVVTRMEPFINFYNTESRGHFDDDRPFPGTTMDLNVEDFVILATAKVIIPEAGYWTFGVNSDDGFGLSLTNGAHTFTCSYPSPRGPGDTLEVFNIVQAGPYDLRLVFYERGGGSELELFAAKGSHTMFNSTAFHLVGDLSSGGLQVGEENVWFANYFDDSAWTAGIGGVGYEAGSGSYGNYFKIDVRSEMEGKNGTCYIRIPFEVDNADFSDLILKVRYDDGFIAYINGAEVARRNFSGDPQWNSTASGGHDDGAAVVFETIDISEHVGALWAGNNLLAIHALNVSTGSTDFLISAELAAGEISQGDVAPTAVEYTGAMSLSDSTNIKARVLDGKWSALSEATFAVGPVAENIRITEIMYHPQDTNDPNDPNEEYIELKNIGPDTLNLNLVRFTNGIDFTFPSLELGAGQLVLVVKDLGAFEAQYGAGLNVAGQYTGSLDNGGERVRLEDAAGQVMLDFRFKDGWRPLSDGRGFSLTIVEPANPDPNSWALKASWRASAYSGGSPGEDDSGILPNPGDVVINEVLAHSDDYEPDFIELHNTTDGAIDIGGWYLSDGQSNPMKYWIADRTMIDPHGYKVFYEDVNFGDISGDPGRISGFALSENGEQVVLTSAEGGVLTGYQEIQEFGASERGVSFGRYATSTGKVRFVAMSEARPGQANAYPKVGPVVITEIMYNPNMDRNAEFVELYNAGSTAETLYDFDTGEPWRFVDDPDAPGVEFIFPYDPPIVVEPGEYILLVKNLAAFSTYFSPPGGTQVFEWFDGRLDNGGEDIRITKPGDVDLSGTRYYITVDRVDYDDELPWPVQADGYGASLSRRVTGDYANDPDNWTASSPSPGVANP